MSKGLDDDLGPKTLTMPDGLYAFGKDSSQILPRGKNTWVDGPNPHQRGTFNNACAVKISQV